MNDLQHKAIFRALLIIGLLVFPIGHLYAQAWNNPHVQSGAENIVIYRLSIPLKLWIRRVRTLPTKPNLSLKFMSRHCNMLI